GVAGLEDAALQGRGVVVKDPLWGHDELPHLGRRRLELHDLTVDETVVRSHWRLLPRRDRTATDDPVFRTGPARCGPRVARGAPPRRAASARGVGGVLPARPGRRRARGPPPLLAAGAGLRG